LNIMIIFITIIIYCTTYKHFFIIWWNIRWHFGGEALKEPGRHWHLQHDCTCSTFLHEKTQHDCVPWNIDIALLTIFLHNFRGLGLTTKLNCWNGWKLFHIMTWLHTIYYLKILIHKNYELHLYHVFLVFSLI